MMRERADRLMGVTRLHTPTTDEPLIVLLIDEIAALTGWITDRTMKKRIDSALSLLLTQGRAVGVVVIGAVQDPRKDVIPQRDLFTIRIGLRGQRPQPPRPARRSAYNRGAVASPWVGAARRRTVAGRFRLVVALLALIVGAAVSAVTAVGLVGLVVGLVLTEPLSQGRIVSASLVTTGAALLVLVHLLDPHALPRSLGHVRATVAGLAATVASGGHR